MPATDLEAVDASTDGQRSPDRSSRTADPRAGVPLEADEVFHLLQTRRRRLALRYLRGTDGSTDMGDLAEQVAAWENDTTVRALSSKERQRVYIPLYQTHLPKLDEAGVIEYDQSRGVVEPTDSFDHLYEYLPGEEDGETSGGATPTDDGESDVLAYYGGATLFSSGLLVSAWAGLLALSGTVVAMAITLLYAAITVSLRSGVAGQFRPIT